MNTVKFKKIKYTDDDMISFLKIITPYLLDNKMISMIKQMIMNNIDITEKLVLFSIKCGYNILHDDKSLKILLNMDMNEIFKYACIHHMTNIIKYCFINKFLPKLQHLYYVLLGRELSYRITFNDVKTNIKKILVLFIDNGFQINDDIYELLVAHDIDIDDISMHMISKDAKKKIDMEFVSVKTMTSLYNKEYNKEYNRETVDKKNKSMMIYRKIEKNKYKCTLCYLCMASQLCNIISYLEASNNRLNDECMHNSVNNLDYNVFEYIHDTYNYIPSIFTIMTIFDNAKRFTFLHRFYPHLLESSKQVATDIDTGVKEKQKRVRKPKNT
jgi:hypothetical protein